jgi:vitamin B12/bleomycin/antimicrobial peptide transport system ATP-binding/permease protein
MAVSRRFWRETWSLLRPYWTSDEKGTAWALLAAVVALTLAMVWLNVLFQQCYGGFYDALQAHDGALAVKRLAQFGVLAAAYMVGATYQFFLGQTLQLRWRRWITDRFLHEWLGARTYYGLQISGTRTDNPDQRIAEDLRILVDSTLGLALGLLTAVASLVAFGGVLWSLSGSLPLRWRGAGVDVPGYLVWVAILYAGAGSWITHKLGRPLVALNFEGQRREADFRYGLVRFREHAEGVALHRGERGELDELTRRLGGVLDNFWRTLKRQKVLSLFTTGYGQVASVFPLAIALPRFFSGALQLGGLVQIGQAFGQVQGSLSWFVGSYGWLASWRATAERLVDFEAAMRRTRGDLRARRGIAVRRGRGDALVVEAISVQRPDGQPLHAPIDLAIASGGDSLLVCGASGCGKSTLFRAIAGVWPFGTGTVRWPRRFEPMFLPQRAYLPLGSLRQVVTYPAAGDRFATEQVVEALETCGLPHLVQRLDEERPWSEELSPGEAQRIAFARALLHRPAWLFLDEATSAVDGDLERQLYRAVRERLPRTTIVSIGHRRALAEYHARTLELDARGAQRELRRA